MMFSPLTFFFHLNARWCLPSIWSDRKQVRTGHVFDFGLVACRTWNWEKNGPLFFIPARPPVLSSTGNGKPVVTCHAALSTVKQLLCWPPFRSTPRLYPFSVFYWFSSLHDVHYPAFLRRKHTGRHWCLVIQYFPWWNCHDCRYLYPAVLKLTLFDFYSLLLYFYTQSCPDAMGNTWRPLMDRVYYVNLYLFYQLASSLSFLADYIRHSRSRCFCRIPGPCWIGAKLDAFKKSVLGTTVQLNRLSCAATWEPWPIWSVSFRASETRKTGTFWYHIFIQLIQDDLSFSRGPLLFW